MTQLAKWLTLPQLISSCSYWGHSPCKNKSGSSKISTYLMVEINCKVFKIYWYVCCWPRPRKVCAGPIFWVWPFNHLRSVVGFCAFCLGGGEGRGVEYSTKSYTGRLLREVQSLPFYMPFLQWTGTIFVYLLLTNGTPFTYLVRTLHPLLTALNVRSFNMNKSIN